MVSATGTIMLSVLSDCMTCPLSRVWIFKPLPPAGSSSAVTIHGPKPPVRSKFLPMSHAWFCADIRAPSLRCRRNRPLADDEDELGFVVERLGRLRPDDRLTVRHERGTAAHEDGREFRNVVALRAFLDVFEIVEAEADDLARRRHRQTVGQALERAACARGRALGRVLERRQVAVVAAQAFA